MTITYILLIYVALDLIFAVLCRRCVLPGLKCAACKERGE